MPNPLVIPIVHVAASPTYRLLLTFENGETRVLDAERQLPADIFARLQPVFMQVYVAGGDIEWPGDTSIATSFFYDRSTPC
jgi:hypothetical protein